MVSRIAVVGVGAIGGYAAAQASRAGHELVFCSRRPFDELVVETASETITVGGPALVDPADARPVDWVMLATKTQQNQAVMPWLERLCDDSTQGVLVLQNGIDGGAQVAAAVAPAPLVPSVVMWGAELVAPGHVRHHSNSVVRVPATTGARVPELFAGSAMEVDLVDDFLTAAWNKLVMNAVGSAITTVTGRRMEVFHDPDIESLARAVALEAITVGRAAGARIDLDAASSFVDILQAQPLAMGSSMLYDLGAGRPLEHEAITGAVVRTGAEHSVPTPVNSTLLALLRASDPGRVR